MKRCERSVSDVGQAGEGLEPGPERERDWRVDDFVERANASR